MAICNKYGHNFAPVTTCSTDPYAEGKIACTICGVEDKREKALSFPADIWESQTSFEE
jgi:hypothetical protein